MCASHVFMTNFLQNGHKIFRIISSNASKILVSNAAVKFHNKKIREKKMEEKSGNRLY